MLSRIKEQKSRKHSNLKGIHSMVKKTNEGALEPKFKLYIK